MAATTTIRRRRISGAASIVVGRVGSAVSAPLDLQAGFVGKGHARRRLQAFVGIVYPLQSQQIHSSFFPYL